ncbi:MAG: hypothetical protein COB09_19065 [Thalassobium sp.]|nr:MAG: hypothetical protein COB09_19065 [Thalassobium sp.]
MRKWKSINISVTGTGKYSANIHTKTTTMRNYLYLVVDSVLTVRYLSTINKRGKTMQTQTLKYPEVTHMPYHDLVRDFEAINQQVKKEIALAQSKLENPTFQEVGT